MSKIGSAAKVKLNSFDDLFGTEQPKAGTEQVQEIALSELHEFKGHPFKVLDDEKMQETVESVREHGVLNPVIVRKAARGYEMLAGHNRTNAAKIAGLSEVPAIVKTDLSDEDAYVYVIETNLLQRSFAELLPSEKAAVLVARYEKISSQGETE